MVEEGKEGKEGARCKRYRDGTPAAYYRCWRYLVLLRIFRRWRLVWQRLELVTLLSEHAI